MARGTLVSLLELLLLYFLAHSAECYRKLDQSVKVRVSRPPSRTREQISRKDQIDKQKPTAFLRLRAQSSRWRSPSFATVQEKKPRYLLRVKASDKANEYNMTKLGAGAFGLVIAIKQAPDMALKILRPHDVKQEEQQLELMMDKLTEKTKIPEGLRPTEFAYKTCHWCIPMSIMSTSPPFVKNIFASFPFLDKKAYMPLRELLILPKLDGTLLQMFADPNISIQPRLHATCTLLRSLAELHKIGMIHHDIKPANILVGSEHDVYLADFGLTTTPTTWWCRSRRTHNSPLLCDYQGTVVYMGPEVFFDFVKMGYHRTDYSTDVYGMGWAFLNALWGYSKCLNCHILAKSVGAKVILKDGQIEALDKYYTQLEPRLYESIFAQAIQPQAPGWYPSTPTWIKAMLRSILLVFDAQLRPSARDLYDIAREMDAEIKEDKFHSYFIHGVFRTMMRLVQQYLEKFDKANIPVLSKVAGTYISSIDLSVTVLFLNGGKIVKNADDLLKQTQSHLLEVFGMMGFLEARNLLPDESKWTTDARALLLRGWTSIVAGLKRASTLHEVNSKKMSHLLSYLDKRSHDLDDLEALKGRIRPVTEEYFAAIETISKGDASTNAQSRLGLANKAFMIKCSGGCPHWETYEYTPFVAAAAVLRNASQNRSLSSSAKKLLKAEGHQLAGFFIQQTLLAARTKLTAVEDGSKNTKGSEWAISAQAFLTTFGDLSHLLSGCDVSKKSPKGILMNTAFTKMLTLSSQRGRWTVPATAAFGMRMHNTWGPQLKRILSDTLFILEGFFRTYCPRSDATLERIKNMIFQLKPTV